MDAKNYIMLNPNDIERRSFEIISEELNFMDILPKNEAIIKRIVHTTADFEYARITEIHPDALMAAKKALMSGCSIYSDTRMIIAGISKPSLKKLNCEIYTYIDDKQVIEKSKKEQITRSILGIEQTVGDCKTQIYVIGNAPTALVRLGELIMEKKIDPSLIIGVPVGFVGASESKEFIKQTQVPYIITNGRKGGSTVAVAILNAILYSQNIGNE